MLTLGKTSFTNQLKAIILHQALCRHMRWPLVWVPKLVMIVLDVLCIKQLTKLMMEVY